MPFHKSLFPVLKFFNHKYCLLLCILFLLCHHAQASHKELYPIMESREIPSLRALALRSSLEPSKFSTEFFEKVATPKNVFYFPLLFRNVDLNQLPAQQSEDFVKLMNSCSKVFDYEELVTCVTTQVSTEVKSLIGYLSLYDQPFGNYGEIFYFSLHQMDYFLKRAIEAPLWQSLGTDIKDIYIHLLRNFCEGIGTTYGLVRRTNYLKTAVWYENTLSPYVLAERFNFMIRGDKELLEGLFQNWKKGLLQIPAGGREYLSTLKSEYQGKETMRKHSASIYLDPDFFNAKTVYFNIGVYRFPSILINFTPVETLDLSKNFLEYLSDDFSRLSNLSELRLSNNKFKFVPKSLPKSLVKLYLNTNQLTEIPSLEELVNLTILDVSNNGLTILSSLVDLKKLTDLDVSFNKLDKLNPLGFPTTLRRLKISHNQLHDIPFFLIPYPHLSQIALYPNPCLSKWAQKWTDLSETFLDTERLKRLKDGIREDKELKLNTKSDHAEDERKNKKRRKNILPVSRDHST